MGPLECKHDEQLRGGEVNELDLPFRTQLISHPAWTISASFNRLCLAEYTVIAADILEMIKMQVA